ncbi:PEP-CTERM sorting domain-containing protein [Duganella sp. LX20W]|uniref:PEP-CTERM sorting domain-containing protein n=1 Tax=Rugamonas brunnea TaxID=2758569 RepID=A0A7W2IBL2_9BURK|nr:FxDxF family PEP-CTERM protein [Rugamonas brunnea]MBA5637318.1 PEP-CTERM sorting domain-containing protein [Rugamonas brunnea]
MKLRSLLLAAMLAASTGTALAENLNQNVSMSTVSAGSYTAHFGSDHNYAGAFTDTFTFNPAVGPSLANAVIQTLSLLGNNNLNFTGASLNGNALTLSPTGAYEWGMLNPPVNVSGTLVLTVMGNVITPSASYSGDINVAAVPEPETYGMLLAGLGVVGWLARRRKAG